MDGRARDHLLELSPAPAEPMSFAAPTSGPTDPQDLSTLVGAIYDAALTPAHWPAVLDACREFVGGYSANLFAKDNTGLGGGVFYTDGHIEPAWSKLYFERYARLDPLSGGHLLTPLEQAVSTADLLDLDEFRASRFYREWAEPQSIVDFVLAPIEKRGGWAAMFGVFRLARHGMADDDAKQRMRLLVPHIRRSVAIGRIVEQGASAAASFGDALDGLSAGMFLVDASGHIVHANQAGETLLAEVLGLRERKLSARASSDAGALMEIVGSADDPATTRRGISHAFTGKDGESYVAHVLPLNSGSRRVAIGYAAVAAIFVQRATLHVPAAPEVIARTYALTLSELRVLMAIVQVGGVPETAEALGIAESTVKTHLHRVFTKTGTTRQADLVRLVAGFASPLAR